MSAGNSTATIDARPRSEDVKLLNAENREARHAALMATVAKPKCKACEKRIRERKKRAR